MNKAITDFFKRPITKDQNKDTGMAMVLLLLLLSVGLKRHGLMLAAIAALLVNMTWPTFYRPVAIVWLGLSTLIGTIMSRVLLTVVFFVVVTPIGIARRVFGSDSLRLKAFRASEDSVMLERNHTFTGEDIQKPY
jgi:uncharacterized membrane protein